MRKTRFVKGQHNMICDRSGFKIKSGNARQTWDGLMVREKDFETRHPQDFLRGKYDNPGVKISRPESADRFLSVNEVSYTDD